MTPRKNTVPDRVLAMYAYYTSEDEIGLRDVAQAFGVSFQAVADRFKRYGLPRKNDMPGGLHKERKPISDDMRKLLLDTYGVELPAGAQND